MGDFMDNKEAIEVIRNNWPPSNRTMLIEALELSIKSLQSVESAQTDVQQTKVEICPKCNGKKLIGHVFYDLPSICVYCNGTGKLSTIC